MLRTPIEVRPHRAARCVHVIYGITGKEQIQLVPENPTTTITFNVPEGPPPETIVLEGPGTENMDIEEVRKALQMRWDVFEGFDEEMKVYAPFPTRPRR